jgi:hypothetical protein
MTDKELETLNYIKDNWKNLEPSIPVVIPSYKNREGSIIRHLEDLSNNDIYVFVYENDYTESGYDKFDNKPNIHFVKIPANCGWRCLQRKRYFIQEYFKKHPEIHDYIMVDDDIKCGKMWTIDGQRITNMTLKNYLGVMAYAFCTIENRTYGGPAGTEMEFGHWDRKEFMYNSIFYQTFCISNDYIINGGVQFRDSDNICEDIIMNFDLLNKGDKTNSFRWMLSEFGLRDAKKSVASYFEKTYIINVESIKIMKDKTKITATSSKQFPMAIKPYRHGEINKDWWFIQPIAFDESKSYEQRYNEILEFYRKKKNNKKEEKPQELNGFFE